MTIEILNNVLESHNQSLERETNERLGFTTPSLFLRWVRGEGGCQDWFFVTLSGK